MGDLGDLTDIEHWFAQRGLPHFVEHRRAATQIWTRAIPILAIAFALGGLNALDFEHWSTARNMAVAAAGIGIVVLIWMISNRLRRQPVFSMPGRVGAVELVIFLIGPAVPPILFGSQWGASLLALVEGVVVLAVIYVAVSYGFVAMAMWAMGRLRALLPTFGNLIIRALPLLLLIITVLFLTTEVWQFAGTLKGLPYWTVLVSFMLLGALFLITRLPGDVASIGTFDDWAEVREQLVNSPAAGLAIPESGDPDELPLSRRQWSNVGLVMLFSQAIQITLVAIAMFVVLVGFGFVAMHLDVQETWIGDLLPVREYLHVNVGSERLSLTEPLLRVSGFLASFAGFYFTIYLVTDSTYREEFRVDIGGEMREAFAVRTAYLHAASATSGASSGSP